MDVSPFRPAQPSQLRLLLDHFSRIEDKRSPESVAHRLNEILLVCVCATIAECDSYDAISDWGKAHLGFLQRFLPFDWGVPSGRWLNIMMNRIDPGLFVACFTDWVRACWPEPLDAIAIDGKTVRRSHDRANGRAALHLVSAFAANGHLVLGQEEHHVTHMCAAPIVYNMLINARGELQGKSRRRVCGYIAGAAPPASTIEGAERIGFDITHVYGLTETYGPASICSPQEEWRSLPLAEGCDSKRCRVGSV